MTKYSAQLTRTSAVALAAACALGGPATAGGFYAQEHSVRASGRAASGEATQVGADALWWNPAAIARNDNEVYLGIHSRQSSATVADDGSSITRPIPPLGLTTPVGGERSISNPMGDRVIPNGAVSARVNERLALGLSVTQPFILDNTFGPNAWTRYDTIQSRIDVTDLQATAALRVTQWLDAGVGVSAQYTDAALVMALPNLSPLLPDGRSSLSVDGWDYGYILGGQAHFSRLTLGGSFRSAIRHELRGRIAATGLLEPLAGANFQSDARADFSTPWIATLGAGWRATPRVTVNAQAQRFGWSEYDAVGVQYGGVREAIAQNFKDTTSFAAGLDYAVSPRVTVRGGLRYDPTPTRDDLREPGVADGDRRVYAAGVTVGLRPRLSFDAAVNRQDFEDTRLAEDAVAYGGTPARTDARLRGRLAGDVTTASVGLRFRF